MIDKEAASFIRTLGSFDSGNGQYTLEHVENVIESLIQYLCDVVKTVNYSDIKSFSYLYHYSRKEEYLQYIADNFDGNMKINGNAFKGNSQAYKQLITWNNFDSGLLANFCKAYHEGLNWTQAKKNLNDCKTNDYQSRKSFKKQDDKDKILNLMMGGNVARDKSF